jgi:hypothetical protein
MGFLQHYYFKVLADYFDPPPMHSHAAELLGIAVSESAISGPFGPFSRRAGLCGFLATLKELAGPRALTDWHQDRAIS